MAATKYLVFVQKDPATHDWTWVGTYTAASQFAAKQAATIEHGDATYAATVASSWKPEKMKLGPPRATSVSAS